MDNPCHREDPRWGSDYRDEKAQAIFATLLMVAGPSVAEGCWLDIGCGSGGIATALAPKVGRMVGVDPEPWRRWDEVGRPAGVVFHVGSYEDLPALLGDESVDVVVCNQVYEHVASAAHLIDAIARVLKPGGVCYFAGPNLLWPIEPHVHWPFVHWLPRRIAQRLMKGLGSRRAHELDAYSAHLLKLRGWFALHGLKPRTALRERIVAGLRQRRWVASAEAVNAIPSVVFSALEPIAPGFVFILTKPEQSNSVAK